MLVNCNTVVSKVLLRHTVFWKGTEHNIDGDGWRWKEAGIGTGGDGSQGVLEWVEMDVMGAGNGGDGTEIPSVCRPLVACNQLVQTDGCLTVS